MMYDRIKGRQDGDLKRDAFSTLRAGIKLRSIQTNMKKYYLHKFRKKAIRAWRAVVDRNN